MAHFERDALLRDLRENVMAIYFVTNENKKSEIRLTLMPDRMPKNYLSEMEQEKTFHSENPDVIAAWDVLNGRWLTINVSSIEYVQYLDAYQY